MLGCAITDLRPPEDDEYSSKWWGCKRCTKPVRIVVYPKSRGLPDVLDCPVNRFAPFVNSINCKSFEQEPGIEELWEGEDR